MSPEYSLERLMLKLAKNCQIGKDPDSGKDWRKEEKGPTEDEMVGWYHRLDRHEFEQAPGAGDRQGSLAGCSPWGCKESNMTERLNWLSSIYGLCFPGGSGLNNLPTNAADVGLFLGQEDPLEMETATHSSILAWEMPWTEEPGRLQSMGHKSQIQLSN